LAGGAPRPRAPALLPPEPTCTCGLHRAPLRLLLPRGLEGFVLFQPFLRPRVAVTCGGCSKRKTLVAQCEKIRDLKFGNIYRWREAGFFLLQVVTVRVRSDRSRKETKVLMKFQFINVIMRNNTKTEWWPLSFLFSVSGESN